MIDKNGLILDCVCTYVCVCVQRFVYVRRFMRMKKAAIVMQKVRLMLCTLTNGALDSAGKCKQISHDRTRDSTKLVILLFSLN